MPTPLATPSVGDLFAQWLESPRDGRELFEAEVVARYPALAEEFAARVDQQRAKEARDDEKPGAIIGKYRLIERLGAGNFGNVFQAEEIGSAGGRVALKILKPGMDTEQVLARFEAERQALALMDHPNIAKVFDAGQTDRGRPYFVMELVRGDPITDYCDKHKLSAEERLKLFNTVCQAIQHAHYKGVIHRDIKPSNILVAVHDDVPVPKVIDFGIAKAFGARLTDRPAITRRGFYIGTLEYMSPEQLEMSGLDIDTRSDVYSLGALLYELLTGQLPIDSDTLQNAALDEVCRIVREVDPLRPSTKLTDAKAEERTEIARRRDCSPANLSTVLRGDLDWVVMRALEKDRTRRYESPGEFARDVRRHLAGEPVEARPPSTLYRMRKWAGRNRLKFAAGTAVLVSLLICCAELTTLYLRKRAEVDQAYRLLYASDLRIAQRLWEDDQVSSAVELMAQHDASPGRPDLRGYEWFYLNRIWHRELHALKGHTDTVYSVAFSPDGRRLASGGRDQTVRLWDAMSGQELLTLGGHTSRVTSVAFSPDGQRLASGSGDRTLKVFNAMSGQELLTIDGHAGAVASVAFSPDGRRLASAGWDSVSVWDATSGQALLTLKGHTNPPSGRRLAAAYWDTGRAWYDMNGEALPTLKGHTNPPSALSFSFRDWAVSIISHKRPDVNVTSVVFSPDGRRLASGGRDQTVRVWDAMSGQELLTLMGHESLVTSVAFSPDGRRLASGGEEGRVKVWDATSGQELLTIEGDGGSVASVAFSPDGGRLASGIDQMRIRSSLRSGTAHMWTVKVWDASDGRELLTLKGHSDEVYGVAFSPDGRQLVSGGSDKTVRVWDVMAGPELPAPRLGLGPVASVAFGPDGRLLACGHEGDFMKVWDAMSGQELLTLTGRASNVSSMTFSPDGRRLASKGRDSVSVWDLLNGQELLTTKQLGWSVPIVAFSPDGRRVVLGGGDWLRSLKMWDVESGQELLTIEGSANAASAAFSPDGRRLASGSESVIVKGVQVWDAKSGKELLTLKGHESSVGSVAFSPDGRRLVSGSKDRTVRVWDLSGQELLTLRGHSGPVTSVTFSPDGRRVASGSMDRTVRVWDALSGQELLMLDGYEAHSVMFSPDGWRLASISWPGKVHLWDATPRPPPPRQKASDRR